MGAQALTTGESLGQVASQTLTNLVRIDEVATVPMLRPLIGMDKLEITAEAQRLETFEISIEPDADCCTLFVPAAPRDTRDGEEVAAPPRARLDCLGWSAMGWRARSLETFEFPPPAAGRAPATDRPAPPYLGGLTL